ncbi:hypothetical protein CAOG_04526 [Capsaspora owczarzaki ATCC 30864]|nr:hypothetical protein CAOG_04526 [Capsaspora owczarzaki ATCC 30864]|eukprot:XP_004347273.1 hypothetical protein CAOG_04526 [Capsaspora owczarzaki ATCC 30864]
MSQVKRVVLVLPAITFGLGVWQVQRLKWKEGIVAEMEAKQQATPQPFDLSLAQEDTLDQYAYSRFNVKGSFDHEREIYIGPRRETNAPPQSDLGFQVVTAFKMSDTGKWVLINRGWVPREKELPQARPETLIVGEQQMTAVLRPIEKKSKFIKLDGSGSKRMIVADIPRMAQILDTEPVMLDVTADNWRFGTLPIPGQTRVTVRNEHMQYALTWFTLTAAMGLMFWKAR